MAAPICIPTSSAQRLPLPPHQHLLFIFAISHYDRGEVIPSGSDSHFPDD